MNTTNRAEKVASKYPPLRMTRTNPTLRDAMVKAASIEIQCGRADRNGFAKRAR